MSKGKTTSAGEEKHQIVRIDTAHGYTHIDHLYRRDEKKEEVDYTFEGAWKHIRENWREYADRAFS